MEISIRLSIWIVNLYPDLPYWNFQPILQFQISVLHGVRPAHVDSLLDVVEISFDVYDR